MSGLPPGGRSAATEDWGAAIAQLPGHAILRFDPQLCCQAEAGHVPASLQDGGFAGELIGRHARELFCAEHGLEQCLSDALAGQACSWTIQAGDGSVIVATVAPLPGAHGDGVEGVVLALRQDPELGAHRRSLEVLDSLIDHSGDMLAQVNAEGVFTFVAGATLAVMGRRPDELLGCSPSVFTHPDDVPLVLSAAERSFRNGARVHLDHRIVRPDGSIGWISAVLSVYGSGSSTGPVAVAAIRDVTAQREQHAQLVEATQRFQRAFDHSHVGMALIDLDGRWTKVNPAFCAMTGYAEHELLGLRFQEMTHPEDLRRNADLFDQVVRGARASYEIEKRYLHADGHVVWVELAASAVTGADGRPEHLVVQIKDVSDRKDLHRRLSLLSERDPVTGLYNRAALQSALSSLLSSVQNEGVSAALLMIDLDHFTYLNDALGHQIGDLAIAHVANVLSARVRAVDLLARLGGDEFGLIIPAIDQEAALKLAAGLIRAIELKPFQHAGRRYVLSASVGVVMLDGETGTTTEALADADIAMFDAKKRGRNRVSVYSAGIRQDMHSGLLLSQYLKRAIADDLFELQAQPIVDLDTRATVMYELLIRMRGENGELIAPGEFLPSAVRFGYMPAIDKWVIGHALQIAVANPTVHLTINLSASTIADPGLTRFIGTELRLAQIDPGRLTFEISEADAIANLDQAATVCNRLRALGTKIALDDFGSGFSGFSYLKAVQVDLLKIDGQFITELETRPLDNLIVEAIIHVANGLDLPTIAEYVTSEPITELLRGLGATYGQGFHLGKPGPLPTHAANPSQSSRRTPARPLHHAV